MKKIFSSALIMLFYTPMLISCVCNNRKERGFNSQYEKYINYNNGDQISFTNDAGTDINFTVQGKHLTPDTTEECFRGEIGCDCKPVIVEAYLNAKTSSSRNAANRLNIEMIEGANQLSVSLLDFRATGKYTGTLTLNGDTTLSQMQLGGKTYTDVLSCALDTLQPRYDSTQVWRVFFSKEAGLVGFSDRQTHTDFHLK